MFVHDAHKMMASSDSGSAGSGMWRSYTARDTMVGVTTLDLTLQFAKEHPRYALMYLLVIAMMPVQDILTPHLYGRVVSAIEQGRSLVVPLAVVAALIIAVQIYALAVDLDDAVHMPALERFIRTRALDAIIARHETSLEELETGGIISQLAKLPNIIYKYMETFKYGIFPTTMSFVVGIIYFFRVDWVLGALFLIVCAALGVALVLPSRRCVRLAMARDSEFTKMLEGLDDILHNLVAVYSSDSSRREGERLQQVQDVYAKYTKGTMLCVSWLRLYVTPLQIAFVALFMWRCYRLVRAGKISTGLFVSLFFIMVAMNNCIARSITSARDMVFRQGIIAESLQLFDRPPQATADVAVAGTRRRVTPAVDSSTTVLSLRRVRYLYPGHDVPILDDVSFDVREGERVALTGHIGSGKSTLLRLIMRYHVPDAGEIFLDGTSYEDLDAAHIRRTIAYVPQQPVLFNRTILENILYNSPAGGAGGAGAMEEQVWQLIDTLGIRDMFEDMPAGLNTVVGKHGSILSGGQRQIVWLLRVLLQRPRLLLLDEPTSAVDAKTRARVQDLLLRVMHGRTVVMVTHDESLMRVATRTLVLGDGRLLRDSSSY